MWKTYLKARGNVPSRNEIPVAGWRWSSMRPLAMGAR